MSEASPAVLITGAAKRVGRALALDLSQHGWRVVIHFNSSGDEAEALAADINQGHPNGSPIAFCVGGNLRNEEDVQSIIPQACDLVGPLSCLINNASSFEPDDLHTMSRESWDLHLEVNLRAPTVLAQGFVQQMQIPEQGNIINIIDQRVWRLTPKFLSYTVSKSALWTLTQTLAQALAPQIRVNAIGPGPTLQNKRQSEEGFQNQASLVPLERKTDVSEICDAVRFILNAPAITGQMIALDGGQHLAWQTPDVMQADE